MHFCYKFLFSCNTSSLVHFHSLCDAFSSVRNVPESQHRVAVACGCGSLCSLFLLSLHPRTGGCRSLAPAPQPATYRCADRSIGAQQSKSAMCTADRSALNMQCAPSVVAGHSRVGCLHACQGAVSDPAPGAVIPDHVRRRRAWLAPPSPPPRRPDPHLIPQAPTLHPIPRASTGSLCDSDQLTVGTGIRRMIYSEFESVSMALAISGQWLYICLGSGCT
jgi:hypothetical protein